MSAMSIFAERMIPLIGGLVVWAVHFGVIYGYAGLACARGWEDGPFGLGAITAVTTGATLAALAALAVLVVWSTRSRPAAGEVGFDNPGRNRDPETGHFLRRVGIYTSALAALAVIYETLPVFTTDVCG